MEKIVPKLQDDSEMLDKLRLTLEDGLKYESQKDALDYIGRRGTSADTNIDNRIKNAKEIINKVKITFSSV
jgi:hypothetical protein